MEADIKGLWEKNIVKTNRFQFNQNVSISGGKSATTAFMVNWQKPKAVV